MWWWRFTDAPCSIWWRFRALVPNQGSGPLSAGIRDLRRVHRAVVCSEVVRLSELYLCILKFENPNRRQHRHGRDVIAFKNIHNVGLTTQENFDKWEESWRKQVSPWLPSHLHTDGQSRDEGSVTPRSQDSVVPYLSASSCYLPSTLHCGYTGPREERVSCSLDVSFKNTQSKTKVSQRGINIYSACVFFLLQLTLSLLHLCVCSASARDDTGCCSCWDSAQASSAGK